MNTLLPLSSPISLSPIFVNNFEKFSTLSFTLKDKINLTFKKPELSDLEIQPKYKYEGPSKQQLIKERNTYLSPSLLLYYENNPVMIVEGKNQYVFDENGKRYLDCFGGVVTVSIGHCWEPIINVGIEQMKKLVHCSTAYIEEKAIKYGKKLLSKMPPEFTNIYFVNSGSEATDLAVLMARLTTGNFDIIGISNSYHGSNNLAMSLTSVSDYKFSPNIGIGVHHVSRPDVQKGIFKSREKYGYPSNFEPKNEKEKEIYYKLYPEEEASKKYVNQIKETINCSTSNKVAGFIHETIQGVGGVMEMPKGYLKNAYETIRANGGIIICDEVQSAWGRTGDHFFGFEKHGVVPDIITLGKGIGNGFPLSIVAATKRVAEAMKHKHHINTFGGNPVGCSIGTKLIEEIEDLRLQRNCKLIGGYLKAGLKRLENKYEIVGDIRGRGLMIGIDIVKKGEKDKIPFGDMEGDTQMCDLIFEKLAHFPDQGILLGRGGAGNSSVLRFTPPMIFTVENANYLLYALDTVLSEVSNN